MKTFIGAIIGILIIILIVVLVHKHSAATTTTPASTTATTTTMEPTTNTTTGTPTTTTTADGLQITVTQEGTGVGAAAGQSVTVNYTGMLTNGTVFDSNVDPKFQHVQPFTFTLGAGQVIKGWDEGVLGMKVGEKRHLVIPAAIAYGNQSPSPLIPAGSTLEFDVQMVSFH